ncbi:MAG: galactokinase [Chloroflexota bacterium]|nr:galactokinase [Chloroflexota bacterium]
MRTPSSGTRSTTSMQIGDPRAETEAAALAALIDAAGAGSRASTAWSPGRCTLVGEHVDYAGGLVLCIAVDLGIASAVRYGATPGFLVTSDGRTIHRAGPEPVGDIGDRVLAPVVVLRDRGLAIPSLEVGIAATLPAGIGLASSAALAVSVTTAILRLTGTSMRASELAEVALIAERDVLGIPCGPLDQRAVVEAPDGGALLLDCRSGGASTVAWPWPDAVIVGCDTGTRHDVGGGEYRARRAETERGLAAVGVGSCQELTVEAIEAAVLEPVVRRRLGHVMEESRRAGSAADAMRRADLAGLGRLMSASHASLRDLYEVSTTTLDAVVAAAEGVRGCAGARLVGAGFGGGVVALVNRAAADACAAAMRAACDRGTTFELRPSAGVAVLNPDLIRG